ncbi:hypothetical protein FRC01_014027 [Tulasnella sp. 417]|nr:hypothetical protein FRC01_014027 [Tulasnella sp. 417]
MADVEEVQPPKNEAPSAQSSSEPAAETSGKKRPGQEKAPQAAKKSRSLFSQVFGTLQKAKDEITSQPTEAIRKRREIDARIYGKINRDVNLVRRQEEAKRDRHSALRKEEELAIKDEVMKFRQNCFPRLAGFLLTSDDIPPDTDEKGELVPERSSSPGPGDESSAVSPSLKKPLTHPPPLKQPPALYFLPAILTPAQQKFLDAQQATVKEILVEEQKEWEDTKRTGLEEVKSLRKHAEEAMAPVKAKEEEDKKNDEEARKKDNEPLRAPASLPVAQTAEEEMEVETESTVTRGMDTEERIEY